MINPQEALKALGYDLRHPCSGSVLVEHRLGKFKHYRFRYRVGDGRVICRLGRLVHAYKQPISGLYIFRLDWVGCTTIEDYK